ncbi:MAG: hypothetical protein H6625_11580 [Bdellovibrionaceae bacterium]|nr:hypothetical protein [Pseudobdellovibrionaceae bacterium]
MKYLKLILFLFSLIQISTSNADTDHYIKQLKYAINNQDIRLVSEEKSVPTSSKNQLYIQPEVSGSNITNYKSGDKLIAAKDGSFYLEKNDFGAEDSRLSVAHKQPDGSYKFSTYHLVKGQIHRATQCLKSGNILLNLKNEYSCYYGSENTCRSLNEKVKIHGKKLNECESIISKITSILPYEVDNYKEYTSRETTRVNGFVKNNSIARFDNIKNAYQSELVNDNQKGAMFLMNSLFEHIRICNEFFPETISASLKDQLPMNAPPAARDRSTN